MREEDVGDGQDGGAPRPGSRPSGSRPRTCPRGWASRPMRGGCASPARGSACACRCPARSAAASSRSGTIDRPDIVASVAWTPDDERVAIGGFGHVRIVKVDGPTWTRWPIKRADGSEDPGFVSIVAFSPNRTLPAVGGRSEFDPECARVELWDWQRREVGLVLDTRPDGMLPLFGQDGSWVAVRGVESVEGFDLGANPDGPAGQCHGGGFVRVGARPQRAHHHRRAQADAGSDGQRVSPVPAAGVAATHGYGRLQASCKLVDRRASSPSSDRVGDFREPEATAQGTLACRPRTN